MEKRAVVSKHATPDLKKEKDTLKKSAEAFNSFMDRMMSEPSVLSLKASKEDDRTFEDEKKGE